MVLLTFFFMVSMVPLMESYDAILGTGYQIEGQNYVLLLLESEM